MATIEDALTQSATAAAAMVARGEISSLKLTELVLARIEAANPDINAVVELRRDEAIREATQADRAIAKGVSPGPLHCVPITVKEAIDVVGMRTTWGSPGWKDYVADRDAEVVRRLKKRAGSSSERRMWRRCLVTLPKPARDLWHDEQSTGRRVHGRRIIRWIGRRSRRRHELPRTWLGSRGLDP